MSLTQRIEWESNTPWFLIMIIQLGLRIKIDFGRENISLILTALLSTTTLARERMRKQKRKYRKPARSDRPYWEKVGQSASRLPKKFLSRTEQKVQKFILEHRVTSVLGTAFRVLWVYKILPNPKTFHQTRSILTDSGTLLTNTRKIKGWQK